VEYQGYDAVKVTQTFYFGHVLAFEFIMNVLIDDLKFHEDSKNQSLFYQLISSPLFIVHDVVTQIGNFLKRPITTLEEIRAQKVLMSLFNLIAQNPYTQDNVLPPIPGFLAELTIPTTDNLKHFLQAIDPQPRIKVINYIINSRVIIKLDKQQVNFLTIESISELIDLFPKRPSKTNRCEMLFVLSLQLVDALLETSKVLFKTLPEDEFVESDMDMQVEGDTKILTKAVMVQQLNSAVQAVQKWDSDYGKTVVRKNDEERKDFLAIMSALKIGALNFERMQKLA